MKLLPNVILQVIDGKKLQAHSGLGTGQAAAHLVFSKGYGRVKQSGFWEASKGENHLHLNKIDSILVSARAQSFDSFISLSEFPSHANSSGRSWEGGERCLTSLSCSRCFHCGG